jgi:hypothetical protein
MQEKIDLICECDPYFNESFAKKVLKKAQEKANHSQETVYICYDIGCTYCSTQSELGNDDVITFVEPE